MTATCGPSTEGIRSTSIRDRRRLSPTTALAFCRDFSALNRAPGERNTPRPFRSQTGYSVRQCRSLRRKLPAGRKLTAFSRNAGCLRAANGIGLISLPNATHRRLIAVSSWRESLPSPATWGIVHGRLPQGSTRRYRLRGASSRRRWLTASTNRCSKALNSTPRKSPYCAGKASRKS